jgi:hypothetical protein
VSVSTYTGILNIANYSDAPYHLRISPLHETAPISTYYSTAGTSLQLDLRTPSLQDV